MIVYPAIDLRGGRCVRLQQGAADAETVFSADPAGVARRWAAEGAEWLHVVNLDGALGESSQRNLDALRAILAAVTMTFATIRLGLLWAEMEDTFGHAARDIRNMEG